MMQVDHELTESVTARIPQSVKRQAERDARREHRSLGGHIAWIIAQYYGDRSGPREEHIVQESLSPQEFVDEVFPGYSQWQGKHMTNRQRQKANYDAFLRAMAHEAVSPDIEKE